MPRIRKIKCGMCNGGGVHKTPGGNFRYCEWCRATGWVEIRDHRLAADILSGRA